MALTNQLTNETPKTAENMVTTENTMLSELFVATVA